MENVSVNKKKKQWNNNDIWNEINSVDKSDTIKIYRREKIITIGEVLLLLKPHQWHNKDENSTQVIF